VPPPFDVFFILCIQNASLFLAGRDTRSTVSNRIHDIQTPSGIKTLFRYILWCDRRLDWIPAFAGMTM
jgi:hypothetical protein